MRSLLAGLCAFFLSTPVFATTIVVHGSLGQDCYLATLRDISPSDDPGIRTACDAAVNAPDADSYDHLAALVNRSDIRLRLKDFRGAVEDAERAIAYDSGLAATHINRAAELVDLKRHAEDVAHGSALAAAHLNRGAGLLGLQRYDEAVAALDKALLLGLDHPELAHFNRALAKEALGDIKGAYLDYRQALEIAPKFQLAADELSRFRVITR